MSFDYEFFPDFDYNDFDKMEKYRKILENIQIILNKENKNYTIYYELFDIKHSLLLDNDFFKNVKNANLFFECVITQSPTYEIMIKKIKSFITLMLFYNDCEEIKETIYILNSIPQLLSNKSSKSILKNVIDVSINNRE